MDYSPLCTAPNLATLAMSPISTATPEKHWHLYLIECRNGAFYAGITTDIEARFEAHATGKGARYTRANPPVRVVGSAVFPDRSSASRAEWAIKQLPRAKKLAYFGEIHHGQ